MLEPIGVGQLRELIENVKEYQRAVKQPITRITPSLVRAWYYIPALDMVAASRFIGYKGMTKERYEESNEVDGRVTEPHLQGTGWFHQLTEDEPLYVHAKSLAESLSRPGKLYPTARFYVLKGTYNQQVKEWCEQRAK